MFEKWTTLKVIAERVYSECNLNWRNV